MESNINPRLRDAALVWAVPILFGVALAIVLARLSAGDAARPVQGWTKVAVDLPTSETSFPVGNGADIANSQCLTCHSAGMVLRQPPLTREEWTGEINKMRNAFGAPMPADQVQALATYLYQITGHPSEGSPQMLDKQGS